MQRDEPLGATPEFSLQLPHGRCVGIAIPGQLSPALRAALHPDEQAYLTILPPGRQPSFAAGRVALRLALSQLTRDPAHAQAVADHPLLPDARGAPTLPAGALGSISHKRVLAIALAALAPPDAPPAALGVDLEEVRRLRVDIARRVLTEGERTRLEAAATTASAATGADAAAERDLHLIQHFSIKEAFYKAVNGFGLAHVSFQNVEITSVDGDGTVLFAPPEPLQRQLELSGWLGSPLPGYIVASARAHLRVQQSE